MKYLIPALVFASFFAPSAQAEDILTLLEQKSTAKQPAPPKLNPYNYTVDVAISGEEGDKDEPPFTAKLRIDPSAAPEARATIISASSDDYSDDFKEFLGEIEDPETSAENMAEQFWCEGGDSSVFDKGEFSPEDFTVISETATEAVIKPNLALMAEMMMDGEDEEDMSKSDRKMMKKMMKRLDGKFTVSKPDVKLKDFKVWMTRPMTVAVIAKIKEMEITQSCALAPNGFTYIDTMTMHVKAKALGVGVEQNMDIKISELTLR